MSDLEAQMKAMAKQMGALRLRLASSEAAVGEMKTKSRRSWKLKLRNWIVHGPQETAQVEQAVIATSYLAKDLGPEKLAPSLVTG